MTSLDNRKGRSPLFAAYIVLPIAVVIHVTEEWLGGWLDMASRHVPGVTDHQFWIINALYLAFCVLAVALHRSHPVLGLTAMASLGINAAFHLVGSIVMLDYSPGMISATALFSPLAILSFRIAMKNKVVSKSQAYRAVLYGILIMGVPFAFQGVRLIASSFT